MTSTYPILNKIVNSFLFKKVQADPLTRTITSVFANTQGKVINTESQPSPKKNTPIVVDKVAGSPKTSPKSVPKTKANISTTQSAQPTYTINNKYLDNFKKDNETELFIIYLNRPFDAKVLKSLHNLSSYTILADGAANRFFDKYHNIESGEDEVVPHALVGDFDSIKPDVLQYYKEKGVNAFHDKSQDDSDLEKCLKHLIKKIEDEGICSRGKFYRILITGGFGGRMDHTLNNIHILHKFAANYVNQENISMHLIDNNSIGTCILPGKTKYIRAKKFEVGAGCGMFPLLGVEAQVETKGLRWNVGPGTPPLSFKKFISSSNEMVDDVVEIETNKMILWVTTNSIHKNELD